MFVAEAAGSGRNDRDRGCPSEPITWSKLYRKGTVPNHDAHEEELRVVN